MKNVLLSLVPLTLVACAGSASQSSVSTEQQSSAPLASERQNTCEQDIGLVCETGFTDGCLLGLTTSHVCVPATETAGPPCEQEIARVCGDGLTDACLLVPAVGAMHVCVRP